MVKTHNLITIELSRDEKSTEVAYKTIDGSDIVTLNIENMYLPPEGDGTKLTQDQIVAFTQLLLTPYGHINILERWLAYANAQKDEATKDLVTATKALLGGN